MKHSLGKGAAVTEKSRVALPFGYPQTDVDIRLVRETVSRGRWWLGDLKSSSVLDELRACARGTLGGTDRPGEDALFSACLAYARTRQRSAA